MKQMEVTIMGQSYVLGCPEGGEALLLAAVASVDKEMCTIRNAGKVKARERIAVLAALNLAYHLAERSVQPMSNDAKLLVEPGGSNIDIDALISRVSSAIGDDGKLL